MDNETIRILISSGTTILVAILSNVLVFAVTKLNLKSDNSISIYKAQYERIFAPIHKIIHFDAPQKNKFKYADIREIISNNYSILPESIRLSFLEIDVNDFDSTFNEFQKKIDNCFRYLSSNLGYSKEKLSIDEKKTAKKIINYKSKDYILTRNISIIIICSVIIATVITLLSIPYKNFIECLNYIESITTIIIFVISIIYALIILLKLKRK